VDVGMGNRTTAELDSIVLVIVVVFCVNAVLVWLRHYSISWIGERVVADVRSRVFGHVLSLSPSFFERTRTGEVLSRLTADTTLVQTVVGSSASFALRNLVMAVGSLAMMTITSPKLTGLCLVGVPLVVAPIILFGRRVRRLSRESQDRIADTSAYAGEVLNAMQTVQAFTHEDADRTAFHGAVEESFLSANRRNKMRALMTALVIFLVGAGIVIVLWIGASDVLAGDMTGGELAQFIFYAIFLATGMGAVSETWGDVQRASGATERLMEILSTEPSIRAPANPLSLPKPVKGTVAFENVTFRYPTRPDHKALHGVSFTVQQGEAVALDRKSTRLNSSHR